MSWRQADGKLLMEPTLINLTNKYLRYELFLKCQYNA